MKSALAVLFPLFAIGVFVDGKELVSLSVMEGDSVTLKSGVTAIETDDEIEWRFNEDRVATISDNSVWISPSGPFGKRLQLDNQTGDLKISNIKNTDSEEFKLKISSPRGSPEMTFTVNVSADAEMSVSVMVGDSVTLRTGLTKIQRDDFSIQWMFGDKLIAKIPKKQEQFNVSDGIFRGRLKLNNQTGSLNITNITTTDFGDYELKIISSRFTINRRITVTVTVKKLSVEGDSVTLHTDTEIQSNDLIQWKFGDIVIAEIHKATKRFYPYDGPDGTFRDRLELDHQTGSLTITNTRTTDSGDYKLRISSSNRRTINKRFTVTVTDSGLSTGAVAGIVVGVVLGAAAAAAAAVGIYNHHKNSKLGSHGQENGQNQQNQDTKNDPPNERVNSPMIPEAENSSSL